MRQIYRAERSKHLCTNTSALVAFTEHIFTMLTELRKKDGSVGPNVLRLGMASQILDLRCSDQRRRPTRPSDRGWRPLSTRLRCLPAEACTPLLSCATRIAQRGVPPSALAAIHALVAIVTPTEGVPRTDEGVPAVVRSVDRGRPGGGGGGGIRPRHQGRAKAWPFFLTLSPRGWGRVGRLAKRYWHNARWRSMRAG